MEKLGICAGEISEVGEIYRLTFGGEISMGTLNFLGDIRDEDSIKVGCGQNLLWLADTLVETTELSTHTLGIVSGQCVGMITNIEPAYTEEDHTGQIYNPITDTWSWF